MPVSDAGRVAGVLIRSAAMAALLGVAISAVAAQHAETPASARLDAKVAADFLERVNAYAALHRKLEAAGPRLPDAATPQQIDQAQRELAARIQSARAGGARGDLFTPEVTVFVKGLLKQVFAGPDGQQLRSSIMDENVKFIALKVNQRYPDAIPFASMPPEVLAALPTLPEQMEYRFVGDQLILLDPHAHIIADFIPDAMPER